MDHARKNREKHTGVLQKFLWEENLNQLKITNFWTVNRKLTERPRGKNEIKESERCRELEGKIRRQATKRSKGAVQIAAKFHLQRDDEREAGKGKFQKEKNTCFKSSSTRAVDMGRRRCETSNETLLWTNRRESQEDDGVKQFGYKIHNGYYSKNAGNILVDDTTESFVHRSS